MSDFDYCDRHRKDNKRNACICGKCSSSPVYKETVTEVFKNCLDLDDKGCRCERREKEDCVYEKEHCCKLPTHS